MGQKDVLKKHERPLLRTEYGLAHRCMYMSTRWRQNSVTGTSRITANCAPDDAFTINRLYLNLLNTVKQHKHHWQLKIHFLFYFKFYLYIYLRLVIL